MENIRVDLTQSSGATVSTTFTGGNGEFEFNNVANGDYSIEVILKGYEPARQQVRIYNTPQRGVSVFLTRAIGVVSSSPGGSISAHQLSVPRKARDEFDKGMNLMYAKSDYQGAITRFQRAIKAFPTYYEAYAEEGNAHRELKELVSAEAALRKSIELSSGQFSEAIFMLAGLLNETNRYPDAATLARQGIQAEAASWRGPFELARALLGLKQLEDAAKSAMEARDMKPDYPPTYLLLANIHIQLHDYPALSKDLDGYLKLVPSGPDADQARKTQVTLQAARQQAENQAQAKPQEKPHPEAQNVPRVSTPPPSTERELPPPPEDSSGLPSLPPPVQDIQ